MRSVVENVVGDAGGALEECTPSGPDDRTKALESARTLEARSTLRSMCGLSERCLDEIYAPPPRLELHSRHRLDFT